LANYSRLIAKQPLRGKSVLALLYNHSNKQISHTTTIACKYQVSTATAKSYKHVAFNIGHPNTLKQTNMTQQSNP